MVETPFAHTTELKPGDILDIDKIEKLVDLMKEGDLSCIEIEEKDLKIRMAREKEIVTISSGGGYYPYPNHEQHSSPAPASAPPAVEAAPKEEVGISYVKSPMVGTFYRAPSPETPPFVEEGGKIKNDTVVCIIEAMKVMNEIQAETSGKVIEILIENGEPVEFGQPLMKVKEG